MSSEYSLCSQSPVNVPRVQFKSLEDSFCPQSPVSVRRVHLMSPEYI